MKKAKIQQRQDAFIFEYPEAVAYSDMQNSVFWPATEIEVSKDIQDMRVNATAAERHGIITNLRLFTKYEQFAGNEYWGGRFKKMFPRPCMQTMATTFSFFEIAIHARFYNMLNEALNINTEEFYNSYIENPVLVERMEFIENAIKDKDDLFSLGVFSMVEGAILYSSFAYLKHFQAEGKNLMMNVNAGLDFSVRDENIHHEGGAWQFRTLLKERLAQGIMNQEDVDLLHQRLYEAANKIFEHESKIVDMTFEEGRVEGITEHQMKNFTMSRINVCLKQLGLNEIFEVTYNPIQKWFYKDINMVKFHDFFVKTGNEYSRSWNESKFVW